MFDILLEAQELIKTEISQGSFISLEGDTYWDFNGWKALVVNNSPILYISPEWALWSNKGIAWTYQYNSDNKTVTYKIYENAFLENLLATVTFKIKPVNS